ncbi:hypothetical protein A3D05_04400 [Candidatus Gottesmanbacteria bacterium RIFCSPHIGHO2_02_FULL_40_24]|uniref:Uncharacterized protein n=1 Tax=Candidatus Gottesmanbacteria bacterium RIFCSPHIGHO2_01_FULL_40_15 TaxID=1798376 RepID=A0A1F5Z7J4_9BACT|nr:MAG: hypothetical protein A2777_03065 [Candidatus Gottesmanbacteria bacterium RIFCSPHIGHO2_01_FULL_40_15]OGG17976.1 MAG: hypothetical protein A3D05_04400 [Candidatus Gottesmanbacteria bacterium RIFCSPHIGHO2_02_FULL_40_24]OGG21806.1 MAG: hypothetical protein A3B48_06300 [Candidatus Gottesmanbacteria bacterium RIFCSPLOWO2_01_FULL_40_10]OGG25450.1 MAG: hypothetical protein A3E42_05500 [Candidatus Gottesmanbacteria bacterium RIFCSPHIGHO2_12_FULL_40_13]OGG31785.1 MAG: hypothetical protein A3I80_0
MLTGILLISLVSFIAVVSYRRPKLEQRVIKNIPVVDWLNIFVFPIIFYFGLTMIVKNIMIRPRINILDFEDVQLLGVGALFLIYAFVGMSVHFVGKVLSRYIRRNTQSKIYYINEIFHGKLSHYITFVCVYMVLFTLALLEINYPMTDKLTQFSILFIIMAGTLGGFSATKMIFYTNTWFGGYNKPLFLITLAMLLVLTGIYRSDNLKLAYYPLNILVSMVFTGIIGTFIARQFMVFSRLSKKRRLQFLSRILSV